VHLTLGILRRFRAFFYASAFFWLNGFAVPAPAQVTQTVSLLAVIVATHEFSLKVVPFNSESINELV